MWIILRSGGVTVDNLDLSPHLAPSSFPSRTPFLLLNPNLAQTPGLIREILGEHSALQTRCEHRADRLCLIDNTCRTCGPFKTSNRYPALSARLILDNAPGKTPLDFTSLDVANEVEACLTAPLLDATTCRKRLRTAIIHLEHPLRDVQPS